MDLTARTGFGFLWVTIRTVGHKLARGHRLVYRGSVVATVIAILLRVSIVTAESAPSDSSSTDRDFLWKTVHDRCEMGYQRTGMYAPCTLIDEESGTALYKANFDPYQFLLLPLARVTGLEDPVLWEEANRNYLYNAWAARFLVTSRLDNSLPESDVILTINSKNARTQDQLHIHISCASQATSTVLKNVDASEYSEYVEWKQLPTDVRGHAYQALAVSGNTLRSENLFQDVHTKVTADDKKMENTSVALANVAPDRFLLLVDEGTENQPAAAEILQDHNCSIVKS